MIYKLISLTLTFVLVLTACTSMKKSLHPNTEIKDTHWTLVAVASPEGNHDLLYPLLGKIPTLDVSADGKSVSGYAGCNNYSAPVTMKDFSIQFGDVTSTLMACDQMDIENALLSTFQNAKTYTVKEDGRLILVNEANNVIATFIPK